MSAAITTATETDAVSFSDLGVPDRIVEGLARRAILDPTPIQAATIPDALAGRDVCGKAPTGSGKTLAFGIPLVLGVSRAKPRRPRGLVLVPTRELAAQISKELQLLAKPKGPWIEAVYGGVGFDRQLKALARGVDILVACPGRLTDLVAQGNVQLGDVDFVVIDEADRMADMGFLPEVRRVLDACAPRRQTLLFSATLDGDVDVLITRYQRDPVRHERVADDGDASAVHHFWSVERPRRIQTAAALVSDVGPTVVFCRTKRGAERVARQLSQAGVTAVAIHGDRSQGQRDRALEAFRRGDAAALVATDVAARGIHVDDVACVLHYDLAPDGKAYVHRSGRTARAGAAGVVVTFVSSEQTTDATALQRELGFPVGLERPLAAPLNTPRATADTARSTDRRRPSGAARRKAKRSSTDRLDTVASLAPPAHRGSRRPARGKPASRRNKQARRAGR